MRGGYGSDRILAGSGNDIVYSTGGNAVNSGTRYDTAVLDRYDQLKGCEEDSMLAALWPASMEGLG